MDFRELEYIVSIAKNKGVSKAAEECYVSQPTLSKFIRNIEYILGQPLFYKEGNKFHLTYAGTRYVETAKTILEAKKTLDRELADIKREDIGELKIGFKGMRGQYFLPRILPLFWKQFPNIKIKIFDYNTSNLDNEILNGDMDLAFITQPIHHRDITHEILFTEEEILAVPENHPLADQGTNVEDAKYPLMDIEKLRNERFILQYPDQRNRQIADKLFKKAGIKPNVLLTARDITTVVEMISKGFGIGFIAESSLRCIKYDQRVIIFSIGSPAVNLDFVVAYRTEMYQPNYIKQFIKIAKGIAATMLTTCVTFSP
jgi:DNA-binding transcriptional LysR family regulator